MNLLNQAKRLHKDRSKQVKKLLKVINKRNVTIIYTNEGK